MYPFTFDSIHRENIQFIKSFIDLKMVGYNSFADAYNKYTLFFFKRQVDESKTAVMAIGDSIKKIISVGVN